jgi:hypothetical protein
MTSYERSRQENCKLCNKKNDGYKNYNDDGEWCCKDCWDNIRKMRNNWSDRYDLDILTDKLILNDKGKRYEKEKDRSVWFADVEQISKGSRYARRCRCGGGRGWERKYKKLKQKYLHAKGVVPS